MCSTYSILPRKGEVSPKMTEGEDTEQRFSLSSPSVWQEPATSPWRGRMSASGYAGSSPRTRRKSRTLSSGIPNTVN